MDDRRTLHLTFAPADTGTVEPTRPTAAHRETALGTARDSAVEAAAHTDRRSPADLPPPRRSPRDRVLVLAEHLVGSWASTLRMALGMLACMLGCLVLIALTAGPLPALIGAGALAAVISTTSRR